MTLIVNLSTTHDYSVDETLSFFVKICNEYSKGCSSCLPNFFKGGINYAWVMMKYKNNYSSLIEPYKLGKTSREEFLENLSTIFYFLNDRDKDERNSLLIRAWNSSINITEKTENRLLVLTEKAREESVYLVSNTNELNVYGILDLFKDKYPDLEWIKNSDVSIQQSHEPVEILPNIFLCLSYRYGNFKTERVTTMSLIDEVAKQCDKRITLVSQFPADLEKGRSLHFDQVLSASEFYNQPALELKKNR